MRMLLCIGEASAARAMRCLSGYSTHRREKGAQEAAHEVWNPFHPSVSSSLLFLNLFPLVSPSSICLNDTNIPESPPKYNCSLMCQPRRDQRELRDSSTGPCAVSCGFLALFEAWEAVVHHHAQPEVCSQRRIRGVGLGMGQELSALEAGGGFCLDQNSKEHRGGDIRGTIFCISEARSSRFFS